MIDIDMKRNIATIWKLFELFELSTTSNLQLITYLWPNYVPLTVLVLFLDRSKSTIINCVAYAIRLCFNLKKINKKIETCFVIAVLLKRFEIKSFVIAFKSNRQLTTEFC